MEERAKLPVELGERPSALLDVLGGIALRRALLHAAFLGLVDTRLLGVVDGTLLIVYGRELGGRRVVVLEALAVGIATDVERGVGGGGGDGMVGTIVTTGKIRHDWTVQVCSA